MDWFIGTFYHNPIPTAFLVIGIYVALGVFLSTRGPKEIEKAISEIGLKPLSINMLGNYLNKTTCSCMKSSFDGSRFNEPVIEDIFTGKDNDLTVTLFSLILPTGRTGTRQTVVHLRSDSGWLPMFSIIDEVCGKNISTLLRCEHSPANPLLDPRFIKRHNEADNLRASLTRNPIPDTSIAGMKSPLKGVVIDSTGEDVFFYRHGVTVEPFQYKEFMDLAVKLREMIDIGEINVDLFRYGRKQKAMNTYLAAKWLLTGCPGIVIMMLLGYGYVRMSVAFAAICLSFFVYAKLRMGSFEAGLSDGLD